MDGDWPQSRTAAAAAQGMDCAADSQSRKAVNFVYAVSFFFFFFWPPLCLEQMLVVRSKESFGLDNMMQAAPRFTNLTWIKPLKF